MLHDSLEAALADVSELQALRESHQRTIAKLTAEAQQLRGTREDAAQELNDSKTHAGELALLLRQVC